MALKRVKVEADIYITVDVDEIDVDEIDEAVTRAVLEFEHKTNSMVIEDVNERDSVQATAAPRVHVKEFKEVSFGKAKK